MSGPMPWFNVGDTTRWLIRIVLVILVLAALTGVCWLGWLGFKFMVKLALAT